METPFLFMNMHTLKPYSYILLALILALPFTDLYGKKDKDTSVLSKDQIGFARRSGVDVVQNRLFLKKNRHEFSFAGGFIFDNDWLRYELAEFRYNFHLRETFAIELAYAYAIHQEKSIIRDLRNIPCPWNLNNPPVFPGTGETVIDCGVNLDPAPDPYEHIFAANVVWAPVYGKFALFSNKIYHFDLFLLAGAGYYKTQSSGYFGFNIGAGMKTYLNEALALRLDFKNFTVREEAPFNQIVNNRILSLGLSVFAPFKSKRVSR